VFVKKTLDIEKNYNFST